MKIIQAAAFAALLAGSTVAASADSFFFPAFRHGQNSDLGNAGSGQLVTGRSVGYGNVWESGTQLQEPAISPNGNPTLSDFAAHR